jgi:aspartate 1-decarboxylase
MKYWKKIEAGDYKTYSRKFLEYYIKNNNFNDTNCSFIRYSNDFWNELKTEKLGEVFTLIPELKDGLAKFGKVKAIAIIIMSDPKLGNIHIDHDTGTNAGVKARLQIPVINTNGSRTAFFELPEEIYKDHTKNSGGVMRWDAKYKYVVEPITSVEIIEPTIIRTHVPHTVYYDSNKFPRIAITISFEEDVVRYLDEE